MAFAPKKIKRVAFGDIKNTLVSKNEPEKPKAANQAQGGGNRLVNCPCKRRKITHKPPGNSISSFPEGRFETDESPDGYIHDHFQQLLLKENKTVLGKNVSDFIDFETRKAVVKWMGEVQRKNDIQETVLFVGVNIFDYVVCHSRLTRGFYDLVAVTSMCVAEKFEHSYHILDVSTIHKIMNGKFAKGEIQEVEKNILKKLKYDVNIPHPLQFLHYEVVQLNLETNKRLVSMAEFLLECFTMDGSFSTRKPSLLAAGALYYVLRKRDPKAIIALGKLWKNCYRIEQIMEIAKIMVKFVKTHVSQDDI